MAEYFQGDSKKLKQKWLNARLETAEFWTNARIYSNYSDTEKFSISKLIKVKPFNYEVKDSGQSINTHHDMVNKNLERGYILN